MATPVTIFYESQSQITREDRAKSLTPSFVDGIASNFGYKGNDLWGDTKEFGSILGGWLTDPFAPYDGPNMMPNMREDGTWDMPEGSEVVSTGADGVLTTVPYGNIPELIAVEELGAFNAAPVINTLSFHAVIGETHNAESEITKFPTQAGFEISNHGIRKNRVIEIDAIITNTLLNAVGSRQLNYGLDNSSIVFAAIEALVNSSTVCSVSTNLGTYWPVVFTKFKTKQELGMVDSMKFTLIGEEILVQDAINKTAPIELAFAPISGSDCDALSSEKSRDGYNFGCECSKAVSGITDKLFGVNPGVSSAKVGVSNSLYKESTSRTAFMLNTLNNSLSRGLMNKTSVSLRAVDNADLSEDAITYLSDNSKNVTKADVTLGRDFQLEGKTTSGKAYTVTYEVLHYDFTARKHKYRVHTDDTEVYLPPATPPAITKIGDIGAKSLLPVVGTALWGATKSVSSCAIGGLADLACEKGQDLLDTGMGKLKESIYGVTSDIVNMGGIDGSDSILGMTLDCASSQVLGEGVGYEEAGDILAGEVDEATSRIASGAATLGGQKAAVIGGHINTGYNKAATATKKFFEKKAVVSNVNVSKSQIIENFVDTDKPDV